MRLKTGIIVAGILLSFLAHAEVVFKTNPLAFDFGKTNPGTKSTTTQNLCVYDKDNPILDHYAVTITTSQGKFVLNGNRQSTQAVPFKFRWSTDGKTWTDIPYGVPTVVSAQNATENYCNTTSNSNATIELSSDIPINSEEDQYTVSLNIGLSETSGPKMQPLTPSHKG